MPSRAEERSHGRARLIRLGEDDGAFDREFWQAVAPAKRLEQVWDNPDFRDLFSAFNAASVRYLLVGGYAVGFHAEPRFTKDLYVWIGRVETQYGDQTIHVIGRAELVTNKRASGRPQDLLDVELLLRHSER